MSEKAIYFNIDRCMGCYACQVACKHENDLAPHNLEDALKQTAPAWRRVLELEQGEYGSETINYVSLSCTHCADAPCVMACPSGALSKNKEDARVLVDESKCIGCRMCLPACPFGIPQYGKDGLMEKCTLCLESIESGQEEPACVAVCPGKALHYEDTNILSSKLQEKSAEKYMLMTNKNYR